MRRGGADIEIEITSSGGDLTADLQPLEDLARNICLRFGKHSARVGIAIVDDDQIKKTSEQFFGEAHITDVISFDLSEDDLAGFELVVNADEARRQASLRAHSMCAELALYVAHGLLHQLGYDDASEGEAERMHAAEDGILQEAGFGRVYGRPLPDEDRGGDETRGQ